MSRAEDADADGLADHQLMYGHGLFSEEELDEKYPSRPFNQHKTPPFHQLVTSLLAPLTENKTKVGGPTTSRKKGPGSKTATPREKRQNILERFVSRWRSEVGNDFYPAIRLILPEKDRDRPGYGLKEKNIGRLVVKMVKINPKSEDAQNLTDWKKISSASQSAGDFAGRCHEVLSKRAMRTTPGDMRIAEVNALLDRLASVSGEEDQLPIFETFYNRMNADELMWLIRIILRQMKIGASEKTVWHPDGDALFNVSSSLRRVCWELLDPTKTLGRNEKGIALMSCFQPQLAQFQSHSFQVMIDKMRLPIVDSKQTFWIEEKLDGERMQMHMETDPRGEKQFKFWSRKAKDYTYLYGDSFDDQKSSLTRFIRDAFKPGVENIILDGEMVTWGMEEDKIVGFGTLKSAAISEQNNPYQTSTGLRPLFRVFDCLYLNGKQLTQYTLETRYEALGRALQNVPRRIEIHGHSTATRQSDIEGRLREVVADASEGLVLKNPGSVYTLNERNNMWMKVKPEYMTEFGESLDVVVIGGYWGGGHRGGKLASFLCGLRVDPVHVRRVGGGFRAEDYAKIAHQTDGKWIPWDEKRPPRELIVLGGGSKQHEKPDVWIKPCDSVVLEVKAASVGQSDRFGTNFTLRFPRFRRIKDEKSWDQALSLEEFDELKQRAEEESKNKDMKVENRRMTKRLKKERVIAGNDSKIRTPYAGPATKIFENLNFCVLSEMLEPQKRSKAEIEQAIKINGGSIFQTPRAQQNMICVGDKRVVKVASVVQKGQQSILRPAWIFDALKQAEADGFEKGRYLLPFEPRHMLHLTDGSRDEVEGNVDAYGDSYARDTNAHDLKILMGDMVHPQSSSFAADEFLAQLEEHGTGLGDLPGSVFRRCVARFVAADGDQVRAGLDAAIPRNQFLFAGGRIAEVGGGEAITHYVLLDEDPELVGSVRRTISRLARIPRLVGLDWVRDSWAERTLLDEERYEL
ncbi:DNA ligase I, ATP-dependent family protein [Marssonina coronariae]|uniref:DNA ligase n=1 Tax=Diplocarpon coronariae TaxID=2795749 RepID=A0A218YUK8_9HELO|nr:DNA ligase I, ATP-dependent family protein [Marssonina coronariae]